MTETPYPNARILIVDDQDANLRLVERILKQGGYITYRSISDSRLTVSTCQEFQPDLILLDLMMPHLDGLAVMEQLQPFSEGTYLPVLILTADVASESKRRALSAGAKDFLTKPFDAAEVLLRIKNLLETRFLYQQLQRKAQREVKEQATLLDQASDAILVTDLENRLVYWNQGAERMYGWTASEVLSRDPRKVLHENPAVNPTDPVSTSMKDGKWEGELRHTIRDGREIIVASRWNLLHDEEDRAKARLIINTDITEKKHLEAQLVQARHLEAIGLLAGGVAHDFNNLLTVIIGLSEVALAELRQEEPSHHLISQVHRAGERAASLTRQLMAFSRRQVLAPVVLDLNSLVSETQKMLGRLIGEDIALTTHLDPKLGRIKADPGQMEQVLMNLVINARDAMPNGGRLSIETKNTDPDVSSPISPRERELGPCVALLVRDTGCGMDESTQTRIFEPFFTTKEPGKGTGLGLATVHGIVKQSGGSIAVDSRPGQGTTFTILLPRLPADTPPANGSDFTLRFLPQGKGTVVLAEDEEGVRSVGSMALRSAGYNVLEARDGADALNLCQEHDGPIELLVTDVIMPLMSGRQLADHLACTRPETKVLYVSGYVDDAIVRHGVLEAGMAFLQKPFTPAGLARKVQEILGH
jgi:two-component system, cell cycle sensor histidine kinase and response regulator CckA